MYWFALAIASLMGLVCSQGIYMTTLGNKWKTTLSFVVFTAIFFVVLISQKEA